MLQETVDREEIIERVAALDIGKAELTCCVRVPAEGRRGRRLQEVTTYSTITTLSRYGARNAVSAASISSGASSRQ